MSIIKSITGQTKFTPANQEVNWTRVETLVHGPGAGKSKSHTNSAVFACLMAIATSYPEPPLIVTQEDAEGNTETLLDHPLQQILDMPTPKGELSMDEMLFWTAWAKHIDGNAYWLKVRSGDAQRGNVIQLWPISPTLMRPKTEKDDRGMALDWISYYEYKISPKKSPIRVPVENVVHFRLGLDDQDMRKGLAPLKALVRQISTDEEADKFVDALLKNYAVPGLIVRPTGGTEILEQDAEPLANKLRQKFGNDRRGNIAVLSSETMIDQFGFSPEQLDLSMLHRIPEERISAVMGVPAIVAGLGAGLEYATYSNAESLIEWFTERKMIPQWRSDATKLNVSLKPDFTSDKNINIEFDITGVRALAEDMDAKYQRLSIAVGEKPFLKRNEARTEVGFDPIDAWDEEDQRPPPIPPQFQQGGDNQNGNSQNGGGQSQQDQQQDNQAQEIRTWHEWAIKRIERDGEIRRDFRTDHIPLATAGAIAGALEGAKSVDDVERIFDDLTWMGYP